MIKEQGGYNILLWRPGFENNDPNASESQIKPYIDFCMAHCKSGPLLFDIDNWVEHSVAELKYFDYFLISGGTLDELYARIDNELLGHLEKWGSNG